MDHSSMRIAIIGGGVSGLSLAYYLQKQGIEAAQELEVTLFERKATLGGNAETVWVDLGLRRRPGCPDEPYRRWADLGVNDVNLATYHRLKAILTEIGELERMQPLQNTESYFSRDGRIALTDDADLTRGVSDPARELSRADGGQLAPLARVVHRSALDLIEAQRVTPRYTVGDFFDGCVAEPAEMLAAAAERLGIDIDWQDPELPARLERIRHTLYYPRISAMYFADDRGPAGMPLQAPFEYYRIQEGGTPPDRRYFEHGAQHWLEALADYLTAHDRQGPRVRILRDIEVEAEIGRSGVTLRECGGDRRRFEADLLVMATHAEDALPMLAFDEGQAGIRQRLQHILGKVRYTRSFSVCHTASARLPPDRNLWRTYNIEVRDPEDSFFPYRIDYVVNRHQNDMADPAYDQAGLPQYFVSLVDDLNRIPRRTMLERQPPPREWPAPLAAATPADSGYRDELRDLDAELEAKAWTYFKHNVLDADCLEAQAEIDTYNSDTVQRLVTGHADGCPLLFAGGWTRGAGLQEQCLQQSEHIVSLLLGPADGDGESRSTGSS